VVFTLPDDPTTLDTDESDINLIKRVIGLPGDIVQVKGTTLYINGEKQEHDNDHAQWLEGGNKDFGPIKIPEGKVLMLGDNRDHSRDSRYWSDPFLDIDRIKGRAFVIYWSSAYHFERIFNIIR
jgi:signal peptidase I